MKITPNKDAPLPVEYDAEHGGERKIFPDLRKPHGRVEITAARHEAALTSLFSELRERLDENNPREDDRTPVYQWFQQISNQISKAQSGKGPMRDRYLAVAELALAAILSIQRNEERS
jgi:hypothetical protein